MHRDGLAVDGVIARPSAEAEGPPEDAGCAPAALSEAGMTFRAAVGWDSYQRAR
jgi:hypothetical protein